MIQPLITDRMFMGSSLHSGQCLVSFNQQYYAIMQVDGNFVVYENTTKQYPPSNGQPIWHTFTNGKGQGPYHLDLQPDGNLVVYDCFKIPQWHIQKQGQNLELQAIMQNDGRFVVYDQYQQVYWEPNELKNRVNQPSNNQNVHHNDQHQNQQHQSYDRIFTGGCLQPQAPYNKLVSLNQQYTAVLQQDGNFVVYHHCEKPDQKVVWHSNTMNHENNSLVMQGDGNIVILNSHNQVIWHCDKYVQGSSNQQRELVMQDDGNLVLYDQNKQAHWACS